MSTTVSKTAKTSLQEHRDVHPLMNCTKKPSTSLTCTTTACQQLSTKTARSSPWSIRVLISSPRGWARLGEQFRPRVRAQLRTFFRTGKSAKNPVKSSSATSCKRLDEEAEPCPGRKSGGPRRAGMSTICSTTAAEFCSAFPPILRNWIFNDLLQILS